MTVESYCRGHKIYYDEKTETWRFTDNDADINNNRQCTKCGKQPINDVDFCLQGLTTSDFISDACCGHGVEKGYIKLKDGRIFRESDI